MGEQLIGNVALALRAQGSFGTINGTISGLTTTVNMAEGYLVGVGDQGYRNSGITLPKQTREALSLARVGYSLQPSQFVKRTLSGLKIVVPWGGARNVAASPAVDNDFQWATQFPAMFGALGGAGLVAAVDASATDADIWTPGAATYCSIALWDGVYLYKIRDNLCKVTINFTPQLKPTAEIEFVRLGVLESRTAVALATATPGSQLTAVSTLNSVGSSYGVTRTFTACQLVIEPNITAFPASNADENTIAQDGTTISLDMTMIADDGDPDHDEDRLIETAAHAVDFTFGLPATAAGATCLGWKAAINNIEVEELETVAVVNRYAKKITGKATIGSTGTAGTEFSLTIW